MKLAWLGLVLATVACGGEGSAGGSSAHVSATASAQTKSSASGRAETSAAPSASSTASGLATATTKPAEPAAGLATLFDGPPSESVPIATTQKLGRVSVGLPKGWRTSGGWDSVNHFTREDKSAGVVVLRLDISEGLLDANLATWVKVPFATDAVSWAPREEGKLGRAHLPAKIATGTGKIGKDEASFWHAASGLTGNKYGLVVIAGLKNTAAPEAKEELLAVMRSVEWQ